MCVCVCVSFSYFLFNVAKYSSTFTRTDAIFVARIRSYILPKKVFLWNYESV